MPIFATLFQSVCPSPASLHWLTLKEALTLISYHNFVLFRQKQNQIIHEKDA
jgi:hypothetical protein